MNSKAQNLVLPVSVEAERSILGAILLDNKAYGETAGQLEPEHFSLDSHRSIYARVVELAVSSRPIDMITLVEELNRHRELQAVGGVGYVSSLQDGVPDRPSIRHYVEIVKEKALLRGLIHAANAIMARSFEGIDAAEQILADHRAMLNVLGEKHSSTTEPTRIRNWQQIPTLDRLPAGNVEWLVEGMIPANGVVLWAGESGCFKTWLALFLAKAVQEGTEFLGRKTVRGPVLYLDRENPSALIQDRCSILSISPSEDVRFWGGWQADQPPMIGDPRLLEMAHTMKPLIVVDSFIRFHGADENSATEMGRVMGEVRALANAGAVVLLLHHKPKAEGTQYRGSSDIKAGVDIAFAVSEQKEQKVLTVQCFKNRFGEEIAITIRPKLDTGEGFQVTQDPSIEREHHEETAVLGLVRGEPGISQSQIVSGMGLPVHKVRSILSRGNGRLWRIEKGPRGRLDYYPLPPNSSFSDFQPYSPEKLKSSSGEPRVIEGEL